ncbi:sugar transferase [Gemelliphila palaticanis]|uniref:Sugar transferase n=1 Tax=Gemelliphila palaticanis TaxID=81950 RepID=A0ABX2T2T8_9BACL|nr:sugar transferase [Gemella palaticanis]MBF0715600.1 sugar transferase [Gemella palaticanis]NYS47530.1 sugar transferase [Gemella palaticanis]
METTVIMGKNKKTYYIFLKNIIDRFLALILLIALIIIPIIPLTALIIKLTSRGPIFYKQLRVGKNGEEFYMIKFRSMYVGYDSLMLTKIQEGKTNPLNFKIESKEGYTSIGKYIRKTSIDELPQLINIIRGDMAIIGPRPLQKFEIETFLENSRENKKIILKRNSVKPGLLCYWQINPQKDTMIFKDRMNLDVLYFDSISFITDFKILVLGFKTVLCNKNI